MNKEYFKILKEINSLEGDVSSLEAENQQETYRVDKLTAREEETRDELRRLQEELKEKKLESQKNENLLVSLDVKVKKSAADMRASTDSKHMEAQERERERYEAELEQAETYGFEILEKIDELSGLISEKETFLAGIGETIAEIKAEVDEVAAKNQVQIDSKQKRVDSALEQLPKNFQSAYQSVKSKNLSISSFTKIVAGKCAVCKMSVDRTKESQVEDQLAIKSCSSCGRIFIPNQALY